MGALAYPVLRHNHYTNSLQGSTSNGRSCQIRTKPLGNETPCAEGCAVHSLPMAPPLSGSALLAQASFQSQRGKPAAVCSPALRERL